MSAIGDKILVCEYINYRPTKFQVSSIEIFHENIIFFFDINDDTVYNLSFKQSGYYTCILANEICGLLNDKSIKYIINFLSTDFLKLYNTEEYAHPKVLISDGLNKIINLYLAIK